jgi:hypothetical protein
MAIHTRIITAPARITDITEIMAIGIRTTDITATDITGIKRSDIHPSFLPSKRENPGPNAWDAPDELALSLPVESISMGRRLK